MNTRDAIVSRRTIHQYKNESVPKSVLMSALDLALYAPNHRHTWPWRFFLLGPQARQAFADILATKKIKKSSSQLSDVAKASIRNKFLNPAEAIIFGITKNEDPAIHRENYASLCCAIQNMSLYLHSEGYGSKWSSGSFERDPNVFTIIGESEANVELAGVLWIGKATAQPEPPERPPLSDFIKVID